MDYQALPANELAQICSDAGTPPAWDEFVRRFQRPIALAVSRTARGWGVNSPALIDDLVQETFLRLCAHNARLLKSFTPREPDSIIGFLKVIAANTTHDHLRGENSQKRGGAMERFESPHGNLDTLYAAPGQHDLADKAIQLSEIDRTLQSFIPHTLTERDRTIFWLYFQQGFTARDIAAIATIGLTVKGVESSIHRTTRQLKEALALPPQKGFPTTSAINEESR
jgi:RNA polymerase sigma-70 factor (ECF subfamily)